MGKASRPMVMYRSLGLQAIADSTTSLAEISVVPLDFLLILLMLFTFMVLDRLTYTLGSHLGKVSHSCIVGACCRAHVL